LGGLVRYSTDMLHSAISFGLAINPKSYENLPPAYRKLSDERGTKEAATATATMSWSDYPQFNEYMNGIKLETVEMSAAADHEMREVSGKVIEEKVTALEKDGLPARKVLQEIRALAAKYAKQ